MKSTKPKWTLSEALHLVNLLWDTCQLGGYHIALTGSVLKWGSSNNDLDLVLYPRESLHSDYRPVVDSIASVVKAMSKVKVERPKCSTDYKLVITLMLPDKRRIELFLPNFAFAGSLDTYVKVMSDSSVCDPDDKEVIL